MNTLKYFLIVFVVAYTLIYSISVILWGIKMSSSQKQKTTIIPVDKQQQLSYEYNSIDMVVVNKQIKAENKIKEEIIDRT
jgi:hypothetical protein